MDLFNSLVLLVLLTNTLSTSVYRSMFHDASQTFAGKKLSNWISLKLTPLTQETGFIRP